MDEHRGAMHARKTRTRLPETISAMRSSLSGWLNWALRDAAAIA